MRRTGIVRDNMFLEHKTGIHHIEVPQRLEVVYDMLDSEGMMERLTLIPSRFASLEEIEMVHTPAYIEKIMNTAGEPLLYLDPDTVTSEKSCQTAFLAAGSLIEAVKGVLNNELDNAFALIRPGGHHAERDRQMGFCLFNNEAVAAEYARRRFDLKRILIVDWDVHHPNGTQHIFERTNDVLVFSTHRFPFFPGTGDVNEKGMDAGEGYTINVPLSPRKTDSDFYDLYQKLLVPVALEFKPQLIIISCGFDIHYEDPIGGMKATDHAFSSLTQMMIEIAEKTCSGKIVVALEGGYDLGAMRSSAKAVFETLLDDIPKSKKRKIAGHSGKSSPVSDIIQKVKEVNKPYWKCFQ